MSTDQNKMCEFSGMIDDFPATRNSGNEKTFRTQCPTCGRRLFVKIVYCTAECCVSHYIPPHKVKNWWTVGKPRKINKDKGNKRGK